MTLEQDNERLRRANMALQRRLERARRDALLYAAMVCEGTVLGAELKPAGAVYAAKLREIAG